MKAITFCIATAKNEREYVKLLLKSLKEHTNHLNHEYLVFIDSDNQDTYQALLDIQRSMPTLKICKNPNQYPVGGQRNVSIMFNAAANDIVCYLQSDMVVGRDFDKHISANIDENTVLSCARIEPPLHPASPEKIVKDFGITPEAFDCEVFNKFVDELQAENRPNIDGHFAPFAVYKRTWIDRLGGFDTQFRCSREDSDMIIRMKLNGLNMIQSWNACVYHFTCVSSRGEDWYKKTQQADYKNELQQLADQQELKRFIRKWGFFGHEVRPVYNVVVCVELDRYANIEALKALEPYCSTLVLDNAAVADQLAAQLEFEAHYYSNLRWNYTTEYWRDKKHLFNPTDFYQRVTSKQVVGDTVINIKMSSIIDRWKEVTTLFEHLHATIDSNEIGLYDTGYCTLEIVAKNNLAPGHATYPNMQQLLTDQHFIFS
jgi:GT2 family glycosyltransferase